MTPFNDFGYCPTIRYHNLEVHIGKKAVVFRENTHGRNDDTKLIDKATLPIESWRAIATPLARFLNQRIKEDEELRKCSPAKWKEGLNEVELNLGREILVLVWAVEHLEGANAAIETVTATWKELSPEDRFFFYRLINASTGRAEDSQTLRRKGISLLLLGKETAIPTKTELASDLRSKKKFSTHSEPGQPSKTSSKLETLISITKPTGSTSGLKPQQKKPSPPPLRKSGSRRNNANSALKPALVGSC